MVARSKGLIRLALVALTLSSVVKAGGSDVDCKIKTQELAQCVIWYESRTGKELQSFSELRAYFLQHGSPQPENQARDGVNSGRSVFTCPSSGREYSWHRDGYKWEISCPGDVHGLGENCPRTSGNSEM